MEVNRDLHTKNFVMPEALGTGAERVQRIKQKFGT